MTQTATNASALVAAEEPKDTIGGTAAAAPTASSATDKPASTNATTKAVQVTLPLAVHDHYARLAKKDQRSISQYVSREVVKAYTSETGKDPYEDQ